VATREGGVEVGGKALRRMQQGNPSVHPGPRARILAEDAAESWV